MSIRPIIAYSVLAGLIIMASQPQCWGQPETPPPAADKAQSEELKKEAALNLYRLKRSIEKDGFFSARVALNIWRSTSLDAGTFDPKLYDQLKIQLYEKSMTDSLSCYRYFLQKKDLNNAKTCMLIWRSHAREIDRYDPAVYQKLQAGLEDLTKK